MLDTLTGGQIINLYTTGSINSPSMSINHETISSSTQQCQSTSSITQSTSTITSSPSSSPSFSTLSTLSSTSTSSISSASSSTHRKLTNFTIESILNTSNCNNSAGTKKSSSRNRRLKFGHRVQSTNDNLNNRFNCNNRGPRIPFTSHQVQILEKKFAATSYLSSYEVWSLSEQLNISENRVKIWFQNRRARRKREERLPDEVDKQISNDLIATDCEQYLPRSPK